MQSVLGKYILADSFVHRLDPRVKVFLDIILIILVFMIHSFIVFAIVFVPIILLFLNAKNSPMRLVRMLKPVMFLGIFLLIINFFIQKSTVSDPLTVYWSWRFITVSYESIMLSVKIMVRVYLMILVTSILTSSTKSLDLTRGLEDLMSPLKLIKFPAHIIAMVISIALRFIPTLLEESMRIMKAQASRGVDFKNGGFKTKIKTTVVLVIPLFVSSFVKAEDLANAMETRSYDPYAKRTRYRQYTIKFKDVMATILVLATFATLLAMNIWDVFPLPHWWI